MTQNTCIVTCHGFTGYPDEMEPIGSYLQKNGFDWKNLQLPGHGTTPEDLKTKKWTDWTDYVLQEIDFCLEKYNNNVIMIGLSLGGALTLYTLINRPNIKAGICLATPVKAIAWYQKYLLKLPGVGFFIKRSVNQIDIFDPEMKKTQKSYPTFYPSSVQELTKVLEYVKNNLSSIHQPLLIMHSKKDQKVNYKNAQFIYDKVQSAQKELYYVERSSHVLTRDYDRDRIFSKSLEFIEGLE